MENIDIIKEYLKDATYNFKILNEIEVNGKIWYTVVEFSPLGEIQEPYLLYVKDNKIYNSNNDNVKEEY